MQVTKKIIVSMELAFTYDSEVVSGEQATKEVCEGLDWSHGRLIDEGLCDSEAAVDRITNVVVNHSVEMEAYYQPMNYSDDGTNLDWGLPDGLASFNVFHTEESCKEWLSDNGYDPDDFVINRYVGDDIEDCVYMD